MASTISAKSNLSELLQTVPTVNDAKFVRCQTKTLKQLRCLNEAEVITLFTPFVPHISSTTLSRDMDPFEPLGRALPRQVRHVPYRLDNGMTDTHVGFLPSCGAVVIVICATTNVLYHNKQAFEQQFSFARDVAKKAEQFRTTPSKIPIILLLIDDETADQMYANVMRDFSTLVSINDYSTAALADAVRILFGERRPDFSQQLCV